MESIQLVGQGNVEKYLEKAAFRLAATDYIHFIHSLRPLGLERAARIHTRIFSTGIDLAVKEAMLELSLPKVSTLQQLAQLITHLHGHELKVVEHDTEAEQRLELSVKTCPFDYYLTRSYGIDKGCEYFQSLQAAEKQRLREIARVSGFHADFNVELVGCLCNGDQECKFVLNII